MTYPKRDTTDKIPVRDKITEWYRWNDIATVISGVVRASVGLAIVTVATVTAICFTIIAVTFAIRFMIGG